MNAELLRECTRVAIYTLCFIAISMVVVMLYGLFDPKINNDRIFEVLVPAFQMVLGGFLGFLGGIQVGRNGSDND